MHIDALIGDRARTSSTPTAVSPSPALTRVAVSVRKGSAISTSTLLKRLRSVSKENAPYAAFREVGAPRDPHHAAVAPEPVAKVDHLSDLSGILRAWR
ncbi:hypothetical protein [Streptomyces sp. NBC_00440]|uniref:hypothetical protein n=1 Tax=Streptomyces sp. NBC_00440 TaxID=2975741 RepID=UPI003FCD05BD